MRKVVIVFIIMLAVSILNAQNNWGPSEVIYLHSSGTIETANPSFYGSDSVCFEYRQWGEQYYNLYYMPADDYTDPVLIPGDSINLEGYNYISPFVTYDGTKLYFTSDIPGGYGGMDIWVCDRADDSWSTPVNLGPEINTDLNEFGASLTADNLEIYFSRTDRNLGDMPFERGQIYHSIYESDSWITPELLGEPININNCSWEPSISADGLTLYYCGYRPENPHYFAYVSHKTGEQWSTPVALNDNVNHLVWCPWNSSYGGDVASVSIDNASSSLIFAYWPGLDCPEVDVMLSHQVLAVDNIVSLPDNICISAYPNPFNAQVNIKLSLSEPARVELSIYDICGRKVGCLSEGYLETGLHQVVWQPHELSSGIYFLKASLDDYYQTYKLNYLK